MSPSRFFASGLLLLPLALSTGCTGDPCQDDGFVQGVCDKKDNVPSQQNPDPGKPGADGWCRDADLDGFGNPADCKEDKPSGTGWVKNNEDCDDTDAAARPGAAKNDSSSACMRDADADGYGDMAPENKNVAPGTDCDDSSARTFPGAAAKEGKACMTDADEDGYGDAKPEPGRAGWTITAGTDCDDSEGNTFPGAAPNDDKKACMKDTDGDDYADNAPPADKDAEIVAGSDCDDTNAETHDGAAEKELTDKCTKDADNDGFADNDPQQDDIVAGTDCDDLEVQTFPGASENEAGDLAKACTKDSDEDGYADEKPSQEDIEAGTDCDDTNARIHPDAAEKELPGKCTKDHDEDGFGDFDNDDGKKNFVPGSDCDDEDPNSDVDCDEFEPLNVSLPPSYNIESGKSVVLEAQASGGSGSYEWSWTPDTELSDAKIAQPTASPKNNTTYEVTVTDVNKKKSKSAKVTVFITDKHVDLSRCLATGRIDEFGGYPLDTTDAGSQILDPQWTWNDPTLCQLENSQPSAVICKDWLLDNATVKGELFAKPDPTKNGGVNDDDWIGLVWGVQEDDERFYLMSWKGREQSSHAGCEEREGNFREGIYIRRFDQTKGDPLGCHPLVGTNNDQEATYTVLAKPSDFQITKGTRNLAAEGWKNGETYAYELVHAGERSILRVSTQDGSEAVEAEIVDSSPLESGHFGAFTMSQDSSCFQNVFTKAN